MLAISIHILHAEDDFLRPISKHILDKISIHILHAEDDIIGVKPLPERNISIHILHAEDDSKNSQNNINPKQFSDYFHKK